MRRTVRFRKQTLFSTGWHPRPLQRSLPHLPLQKATRSYHTFKEVSQQQLRAHFPGTRKIVNSHENSTLPSHFEASEGISVEKSNACIHSEALVLRCVGTLTGTERGDPHASSSIQPRRSVHVCALRATKTAEDNQKENKPINIQEKFRRTVPTGDEAKQRNTRNERSISPWPT